jgi:tetratricopeptide (TPR) repeat protein
LIAWYGPNHPALLSTLNGLAQSCEATREYAKAVESRREMLEIQRQQRAGGALLADTLAALGRNMLMAEQFAEAEPVLKECLTLREQALPDSWVTFQTKSALGAALLGQKNYSGAEPLLLASYEGMKDKAATIPANSKGRLGEALDYLVKLYTAWDKPDEAAKWRTVREARQRP